jgi:hypothetical protein
MSLATPHVVLVRPEIPWNTGNAGRTCLAAGAQLHLVGPLGFSMRDREVRRAGLDYWPRVMPRLWEDWDRFAAQLPALGKPLLFILRLEERIEGGPPLAHLLGPRRRSGGDDAAAGGIEHRLGPEQGAPIRVGLGGHPCRDRLAAFEAGAGIEVHAVAAAVCGSFARRAEMARLDRFGRRFLVSTLEAAPHEACLTRSPSGLAAASRPPILLAALLSFLFVIGVSIARLAIFHRSTGLLNRPLMDDGSEGGYFSPYWGFRVEYQLSSTKEEIWNGP